MKITRRLCLMGMAGAVFAPSSNEAVAETYPTRPIRLMVGFPAGSTADIVARLVGQSLSDRLGQPIVIENRPGASSNIATEAVVRARPDGYTLLFVTSPNAVNASFYRNLNYNFVRDIVPVAGVGRGPLVMLVSPVVPAKTLFEFVSYARANPNKISMASSGNGTITHVAGELFKMAAKVDMIHVPYRGEAPAMTDLLGGQVQVMFANLPPSLEQIRAGRLRAIALTTAARLPLLPEVPAMAEVVPGYEASGWQGVGAPKDTPADIVEKLNNAVRSVLADPATKQKLANVGLEPISMTATEFENFVKAETSKWEQVVKSANVVAE